MTFKHFFAKAYSYISLLRNNCYSVFTPHLQDMFIKILASIFLGTFTWTTQGSWQGFSPGLSAK